MSPNLRNLYDSLNCVDEFNQGDRFDSQDRSINSTVNALIYSETSIKRTPSGPSQVSA